MKEQRVYSRVRKNWKLEYRLEGPGGKRGKPMTAGLRDIGGGGFCFRCHSPHGPGTLISFSLSTARGITFVVGTGRILWNRPAEKGYDHGVQFIGRNQIVKAADEAIKRILATQRVSK